MSDIPGTFGLLYTSKGFYDEHQTAAEDFARASLKGMEDAIADPEAAVDMSVDMIDAAGNTNFLTKEGELFRWQAELAEVQKGTPEGEPVGLIDPAVFAAEYAAYVAAGVWPDGRSRGHEPLRRRPGRQASTAPTARSSGPPDLSRGVRHNATVRPRSAR